MRINNLVEIIAHKEGEIKLYLRGTQVDPAAIWGIPENKVEELYNAIATAKAADRDDVFTVFIARCNMKEEKETVDAPRTKQEIVEHGIKKLIDFFTEFNFTPSFRFMNTFNILLNESTEKAKGYVANYFKLIDNPYHQEVVSKMSSIEFEQILSELSDIEPTQRINKRLVIYYGAQGTGKTTRAMQEANGACIVCNSSILPCDLMEDFAFDDGKAAFHPSAFAKAIQNGETVILDEANLLPFDSLRFAQGILDGKDSFSYKGTTIKIHPNFKVIFTMNLYVNGVTFGLPEPLVDRAEVIEEFELTVKDLMGAF